MSFHNIILPKFLQPYLVASPYYSTSIAKTASGRELRSADNILQQTRYILKECHLSQDQFDEFNAFFRARMGQKFSFLLKDPAEHILPKQKVELHSSDSGNSQYCQLYKYYHDEIMPANKLIRHIIPASLRIWVGDAEYHGQRSIKDGSIFLNEEFYPGDNIFVSAEYLTEVRFAQDSFEYKQADDGTIALSDIDIIEII